MKKIILLTTALCMASAMPTMANVYHDKDLYTLSDRSFHRMDTDGDGFISKTEHLNSGQNIFNEIDKDKDNRLTRQEVNNYNYLMERDGYRRMSPSAGDRDANYRERPRY